MLCGKRGGLPFLNATRPDYRTGKCPDSTLPCSNSTSLENTICYDATLSRNSQCPITQFDFSFNSTTLPNPNTQNFGNTKFSFSKDFDSLAASKIKVEAQVCADNAI